MLFDTNIHIVFFQFDGSNSVWDLLLGMLTNPLYQFASRWRWISLALKTRHTLQLIPCTVQATKGIVNKQHTYSLNSPQCAWISPMDRLGGQTQLSACKSFRSPPKRHWTALGFSMPDNSITAFEVEAKGFKMWNPIAIDSQNQ